MEQETWYKINREDLKREFTDLIRAEEKEKRNQQEVHIQTVADLLRISETTVRRHVAYGVIPVIDRVSEKSTLKFRLGDILEILDNGYRKRRSL
jgi:hypothetical protein